MADPNTTPRMGLLGTAGRVKDSFLDGANRAELRISRDRSMTKAAESRTTR